MSAEGSWSHFKWNIRFSSIRWAEARDNAFLTNLQFQAERAVEKLF